jgi:hypothetical protein
VQRGPGEPWEYLGTAQSSYERAADELAKAALASAAVYNALAKMMDVFAQTMNELQPLIWRLERYYIWRKRAVALTLFVAVVAAVCK